MTTGSLFMAAGLIAEVVALVTSQPGAQGLILRILAGLAVVIGAATVALRRRLRLVAASVLVPVGTLMISLAVVLGGPAAADALMALYVLIAVDAAFFFAWPAALAHLALAVGACLAVAGPASGAEPATGIAVGGLCVLVAGVVGWLVRAASAVEVDPLTGLLNRRGLDRLLDEAVACAEQQARPLSVAMVDVDRFKSVNDEQGHAGGDRLLVALAQGWRRLLPADAVLARPGGDEFVVVFPGWSVADALPVLNRLRAATHGRSTVSAGLAGWERGAASSLLADADAALYEAKRAGRDRVHVTGTAAVQRAEVRQALYRGELCVHYQPVVTLADGRPTSAEALVRWHHPSRGLVPPGEFLGVAEGTELMTEIGAFVLQQACAQAAAWARTGHPGSVAVNVAGGELDDAHYCARVREVLERTGLPPEALVLEVTETSLQADTERARTALTELRAMGIRIAVDDFGTGYSSLARLARLPVDILKIDRSFVADLPVAATSAPLIQAILGLARALDLDVVAEGVEHGYQAELLHRLGCPRAQGFLFGRPVEADEPAAVPSARLATAH